MAELSRLPESSAPVHPALLRGTGFAADKDWAQSDQYQFVADQRVPRLRLVQPLQPTLLVLSGVIRQAFLHSLMWALLVFVAQAPE
ncbi:MAG TPA: hypothetical protein VNO32_09440 [Candidatus Acidoferrum sp.]|nr:hypothetical protein [Candidatus Acidoferrum sp.]